MINKYITLLLVIIAYYIWQRRQREYFALDPTQKHLQSVELGRKNYLNAINSPYIYPASVGKFKFFKQYPTRVWGIKRYLSIVVVLDKIINQLNAKNTLSDAQKNFNPQNKPTLKISLFPIQIRNFIILLLSNFNRMGRNVHRLFLDEVKPVYLEYLGKNHTPRKIYFTLHCRYHYLYHDNLPIARAENYVGKVKIRVAVIISPAVKSNMLQDLTSYSFLAKNSYFSAIRVLDQSVKISGSSEERNFYFIHTSPIEDNIYRNKKKLGITTQVDLTPEKIKPDSSIDKIFQKIKNERIKKPVVPKFLNQIPEIEIKPPTPAKNLDEQNMKKVLLNLNKFQPRYSSTLVSEDPTKIADKLNNIQAEAEKQAAENKIRMNQEFNIVNDERDDFDIQYSDDFDIQDGDDFEILDDL